MFELIVEADGRARRVAVAGNECSVGKSDECHVQLQGWNVAANHALFSRDDVGVFVEPRSARNAVAVNGKAVSGRHGPLKTSDQVKIGGYTLRVHEEAARAPAPRPAPHTNVTPMHAAAPRPAPAEALRPAAPIPAPAPAPVAAPEPPAIPVDDADGAPARAEHIALRQRVHQELLRQMDLRRIDIGQLSESELRTRVSALIDDILKRLASEIPPDLEQARLAKQVLDEAIGLGPLEDLMADESVTEVMVNRCDDIFIERGGRIVKSTVNFTDDQAVLAAIERIVAPLGRRIDESMPMVDARLKDGSRVNAIIPPVALRGPSITIRKFSKRRLVGEDLIKYGSLNEDMLEFISLAVRERKNIVVTGGTGSGKTTLLNILSNFIPDHERIVTIEDAAELRLNQPNLVALESRPKNVEGKGEVAIRDLVRNALRMRPDRIVVGECRGGEALDMLQAMNTGHEGSLTTAHANSPRDALSRLEVMVLMSSMDLPLTVVREQIQSAVDLIVHQRRFPCGSRKVTHVCEVTGIESGIIQLQEIFVFRAQDQGGPGGKVRGQFLSTGAVPEFYEELAARGVPINLNVFRRPEDDFEWMSKPHD